MRPRKIDLAFDWMRRQPRRAFHYRDEVWVALAELHPDEFAVSDDLRTPWLTLRRDLTQDARFLRVIERDGDVLRLTDDCQSKIKAHPGVHLPPRTRGGVRVARAARRSSG